MIITIKALATVRKYLMDLPPDGRLEVPEEISIEDLLEYLGAPSDLAMVILVNGRPTPEAHQLRDGDTVVLFPSLEGG